MPARPPGPLGAPPMPPVRPSRCRVPAAAAAAPAAAGSGPRAAGAHIRGRRRSPARSLRARRAAPHAGFALATLRARRRRPPPSLHTPARSEPPTGRAAPQLSAAGLGALFAPPARSGWPLCET
ncbi:Hypothetical predicted protein [Marmota monax]|uniref:Uncharacterized protein n=1 Tax=Marmota monax TaxID=9995 RepID=A0A5E4B0T6_MARMO|nr:Hypothetical predicted protein [Marmota monax]